MNREEYLRGEVQFLSELIDLTIKKFPETKKFLSSKINPRIKRNKLIEEKLNDPAVMKQNVVNEIKKMFGGAIDL